MRIVAGKAFTLHIRDLIHGRFLVAGVADFVFRQNEHDGSLSIRNTDHMADGTGVSEIEVNGLTFRPLRVAGEALAACWKVPMIGG